MASFSVSTALVEDLLVEVAPELEDAPDKDVIVLSARLMPALDLVVWAYQLVSSQANTEVAFRRFIGRMAEAGE